MTYVAQTGRTPQVRMKENLRAFTNSDAMASALAMDAMNNHHRIAWEEAEVLHNFQSMSASVLCYQSWAYPLTTSTDQQRKPVFSPLPTTD